jgi:Zn-finger nucleic acid-binding protein
MRTYERNGVHVDQCTDCRGIFLDRGELDRLVDAENAWHGDDAAAAESEHREPQRGPTGSQSAASGAGLGAVVGEVLRQVQGSKHSGYGSGHQSGHQPGYGKRRKKESFLGDLFG